MSFTRADYEYIFDFARRVYRREDPGTPLEEAAVEIMNMVEDCVGQQPDFPENARSYKRLDRKQ